MVLVDALRELAFPKPPSTELVSITAFVEQNVARYKT